MVVPLGPCEASERGSNGKQVRRGTEDGLRRFSMAVGAGTGRGTTRSSGSVSTASGLNTRGQTWYQLLVPKVGCWYKRPMCTSLVGTNVANVVGVHQRRYQRWYTAPTCGSLRGGSGRATAPAAPSRATVLGTTNVGTNVGTNSKN